MLCEAQHRHHAPPVCVAVGRRQSSVKVGAKQPAIRACSSSGHQIGVTKGDNRSQLLPTGHAAMTKKLHEVLREAAPRFLYSQPYYVLYCISITWV